MTNKQLIVKILGLAAILFLTGLSLKTSAQTPEEFRERYGNPQSGVYTIRTGIGARISFSDASQASEIDVAPLRSEAPGSAISAAEAAKILDELMPTGRRGKLVTRGKFSASCAMGHFEDYENASITWTDRCESEGGGVFRVTIRRK
jgi:hypothetical protein